MKQAFYKSVLNDFFSSITAFGSPVFYILVILVLIKINAFLALKMFWALVFVELICVGIKLIYKKERPVPQERDNIYNKIDANSFPSIHSARVSLMAVMISFFYKDAFIIIASALIMLFVGYSRIYLKRHHFIDVFCGFLVGIAIAIITLYI